MTQLPPLYKFQNKKPYSWKTYLNIKNENDIDIITKYGYVNGAQTTKSKNVISGKANRTTLEQATLEMKSKWNDKKTKEQYNETVATIESVISFRPMLAKTFDNKVKINYPVMIQRKYDGIRCVAYLNEIGDVLLESRNGTAFSNFNVLREQLKTILRPNIYLDGELYSREIPFETLSGFVRQKKENSPEIDKIEYHVYDLYLLEEPEMVYFGRENVLQQILPTSDSLIKRVITDSASDFNKVEEYHQQYIEEGFEGIMLRSNGPYEMDKRSKYLHKYKKFMEEEFCIVGFHEGTAGDKGCVIWDCHTKDGKSFAVRPRGTIEQRKEWLNHAETLIGSSLTVIFQEYSQEGIPRFPVGKALRENY